MTRPSAIAESLPAIQGIGLTKSFLHGRVRAVRGVDLTIHRGESVAIVGRSGSGKSTLLYLLSGLVEPDTGEVLVEGRLPRTAAAWTTLRAHIIGMVFQDAWLLPTLTAQENVELPMIGVEASAARRDQRARALLKRAGVAHCADRMPAQLSGGERQRVAVARSLANNPKILLADEPTGELDTENAAHIVELLLDLHRSEGLTLVVVTHDPDVAAQCGRRLVITDGMGHLEPRPTEPAQPVGGR